MKMTGGNCTKSMRTRGSAITSSTTALRPQRSLKRNYRTFAPRRYPLTPRSELTLTRCPQR